MPFVLGHALSRRAIHGGNATNDRLDAHNMAARRRGGLRPQADVYPRRMRATRDLLRRRQPLKPTRAEGSAHRPPTGRQYNLGDPLGRMAKPQNRRGLIERFDHACVQKNIAVDLALVDCYDPLLAELERSIEKTAHRHDPVSLARWRTSPSVGNILALVRLYEIEDIARFPRVQAFVSYSHLVKRARASHGKRHGTSGKKIGHAHLKWAFSDAAVLFLKHHEPAQKYLATLATQHGQGKALSILAHTRGRAVSCRLTPQVAFDQARVLAA